MGRYSGFIAMYATLASRDVDCCSIPESPFYLEGPGGLYEFVEQRLKENGHIVIVVAEGAGQDHVAQHVGIINEKDESGNRLLLDIGLWLSQKIKDHFTRNRKLPVYLKYIDQWYEIINSGDDSKKSVIGREMRKRWKIVGVERRYGEGESSTKYK
ncbi:ATP-dependent 6-phosphofructokinase 4, chloroplastic-like isoform X2 [Asparagus officinalis]|uniref:ATP-dependent 6-phosphofructokinase 4, chloroplastic-like isoform X2 n=1 Tax=Asparagus officinalis TaxID=4686 RepID=UPI00098DF10F|nr:ATP-dependent 6-phosphofructokinase 4, chloroplastic-like isoform X2 [Asparagus officinalis]